MPRPVSGRSAATTAPGVRPGQGSTWSATLSPAAFAAVTTGRSRASSTEPGPHHDTITVSIPVAAISRICARSTEPTPEEYGPRAG
jgi:hypothetical protein